MFAKVLFFPNASLINLTVSKHLLIKFTGLLVKEAAGHLHQCSSKRQLLQYVDDFWEQKNNKLTFLPRPKIVRLRIGVQ